MGGPQSNAAEFALRNDLSKWPPHQLQQAKSEVGIPPDKDNNALNLNEMKKLLEFSQRRFPKPPTPGGPSNMMHPPPNLQQRPPQQLQQMQQHPQGRSIKRNSTSPGEEPDNIPSGSSPPDRKRLRRSPENASMVPKGATPMPYPQTPQQMSAGPPPGQQQGLPPPGHPQQQPPPNMILRGNIGLQPGQMPPQMTMNGQPNMMMGQQGPQGQQGMGGMQGGQMAPQGQMGPPAGGMAGQMGYNTSRVPLHQVHNSPGVMHGQMNAGSPAGPDPSFNPGGPNPGGPPGPGGPQPFNPGAPGRMLDSKPPQARANVPPPTGQGSMMPPPSPANNAKDAQKDVKAESPRGLGQPPNSQQPHGQPGQIPPPSGPPNQQPGTPGPQGPPQQQQGGNQQTPGPAGLPGMPGMNSSSNQNPNIMGGGGGMGMMGSDSMLFNTAMDFSTVVGEFEFGDVGSNIVDFERDFGQWFNGPNDDLGGGLEMKPIG
ncbi:hypothetical protein EST38_g1027 [Candolleomyces aberdarensis]|uniref:Uncharacterized protein n=1 Tax=Candolleomyces aberdarensis TaxID=2316362 RepID=A0A4Q2DZ67_9AGAR|nr:hypothetical protein EST38_g1027 [Candolleomyces aberdarensis]